MFLSGSNHTTGCIFLLFPNLEEHLQKIQYSPFGHFCFKPERASVQNVHTMYFFRTLKLKLTLSVNKNQILSKVLSVSRMFVQMSLYKYAEKEKRQHSQGVRERAGKSTRDKAVRSVV